MNDVKAILSSAEIRQERLAAIFRIVVFLALLATVLSLRRQGAHHHPILAVTYAYGALALIGLALAWFGLFHPVLPYFFVTLEVGMLVAQTALMNSLMGWSPAMMAAAPVATLIFVLLAHAAMRYRPWLVVYAAGLFGIGLVIANRLMTNDILSPSIGPANDHDFMHHQALPFTALMLTALILFITGRGTRKLLRASIEERLGRARLSRFFAPDIASQLVSGSAPQRTEGRVQPIVALFADIRSFSSLAETMTPDDLSSLLTEFREILAKSIGEHGGVVDKFIGDAVLAIFGFPEFDDDPPERAIQCALAMHSRVTRWSEDRLENRLPAVEVGIGLHAGDAFVGVIGSDSLLEFTVIGDTVNVAERMERLTRELDADIVVSDGMVQRGIAMPRPNWILAKNLYLAGRNQRLDVYFLPRNYPISEPEQMN